MNQPLISIITIVYNAIDAVEQTILSVINQTYSNIEYIIIDGGSTDGTVDIIEKYSDKITYWISEPDKGIYDAMNKGIDKANGKWINFMNAGDFFYDKVVLSNIFCDSLAHEGFGVLFGHTELRYSFGRCIYLRKSIDVLPYAMAFTHQSAFILTDIHKNKKFDLSFKIKADHAFFIELYKEGVKFYELDDIVSSYDCNGISSARTIDSLLYTFIEQNKLLNIKSEQKVPTLIKTLVLFYIKRFIPNFLIIKFRKMRMKYLFCLLFYWFNWMI